MVPLHCMSCLFALSWFWSEVFWRQFTLQVFSIPTLVFHSFLKHTRYTSLCTNTGRQGLINPQACFSHLKYLLFFWGKQIALFKHSSLLPSLKSAITLLGMSICACSWRYMMGRNAKTGLVNLLSRHDNTYSCFCWLSSHDFTIAPSCGCLLGAACGSLWGCFAGSDLSSLCWFLDCDHLADS